MRHPYDEYRAKMTETYVKIENRLMALKKVVDDGTENLSDGRYHASSMILDLCNMHEYMDKISRIPRPEKPLRISADGMKALAENIHCEVCWRCLSVIDRKKTADSVRQFVDHFTKEHGDLLDSVLKEVRLE